MPRVPNSSGLPISRSGIPRPVSGQYASSLVDPKTHALEVKVRTTGSLSAMSEITQTRSTTQPAQIIFPSNEVQSGIQSSQAGTSQSLRSSITGTKQVQSNTKVKITKPTGKKITVVKKDKSLRNSDSTSKVRVGSRSKSKTSTSSVPIPPPSVLRKQVALHVKGQVSKAAMGSKVTAVATKKSRMPPLEKIMTPTGPQQVMQKIITEKRVERSKHGEIVSRNLKTIETNLRTGETVQIEEEFQQLNPDYPVCEGPLKEIVTIVTEKNITDCFETRRENVVRETIKLNTEVGMESAEVDRLVEEEKEDIENILLCSPPELANGAPTLYPLHKRLNALRLSPENILMIEKSVINPQVTADEALPERTPELMARIMETSEQAHIPSIPPQRIFNTLFRTGPNDDSSMIVSSVSPGPLADVVVPTEISKEVHEEMLSNEMEEASIIVQTGLLKPPIDNFVESEPSKPRKRARRKRRYTPITHEDPPWENADMHRVIEAVGALPKNNVIPTDIHEKQKSGKLSKALVRGVEYVLDVDPLQYSSRVQLRGTQPPPWFPGYMMALSDTSDIVGIAKSPSQVLFSAWKSVQPNIFSDESILYN